MPELLDGRLAPAIVVDALQGGAGTSANMNVNEVLANRALELLGAARGDDRRVSPTDHVNLHQSTNDVFPTALRVAALWGLGGSIRPSSALQEAFQAKERAFAHIVKVGRTEMQDAVLTTLGREMSAYAEALNRDRWRLAKCGERLRVVNLGGTAIGTGLAAPRDYIFRVVEELRDITGLGLARAENLVEATQNADVFVEVSGLLKTLASTLIKICGDLRLLSSGPDAGLGEIRLPARQAGSSIMPGKVNPVIPEAVTQAALLAIGHDQALTMAVAMGSLELNPFLPLVAHCLLESFDLLARGVRDAADAVRRRASRPTRRAAGSTWRTPRPARRRSCRCSGTSGVSEAGGHRAARRPHDQGCRGRRRGSSPPRSSTRPPARRRFADWDSGTAKVTESVVLSVEP